MELITWCSYFEVFPPLSFVLAHKWKGVILPHKALHFCLFQLNWWANSSKSCLLESQYFSFLFSISFLPKKTKKKKLHFLDSSLCWCLCKRIFLFCLELSFCTRAHLFLLTFLNSSIFFPKKRKKKKYYPKPDIELLLHIWCNLRWVSCVSKSMAFVYMESGSWVLSVD